MQNNLDRIDMRLKQIFSIITGLFLMTLLVACDKNVNDEVKIEKAMKEYAKINFSNPNNYKGIEEVIPIDTIDFEKNARELIEARQLFDSIYDAKYDYIRRVEDFSEKTIGELNSTYNKFKINDAKVELKSIMAEIPCYYKWEDSIYCAKIDSLLSNYRFAPMRCYAIKVKTIMPNALEYVIKTYTAYVCYNSEAVITASTLGYNISIKMFDLDNGNELQLLIDYSKELAERRTFMQNLLKRGEDKAKDISKLCFKALDYENGVEWSPFE